MDRIGLRENWTGQAIILVTLALLAVGVVMVHSAIGSVLQPGLWYTRVDLRHTLYAAIAAMVLLVGWRFDYRLLRRGDGISNVSAGFLIFAVACSVLVFVPGVGRQVGGDYRWIRLGPAHLGLGFQPSEVLKLAIVIFLSAWLTGPGVDVKNFRRTFIPAMGLIVLCLLLVVSQDFGTAVVIGLASTVVVVLAGVPLIYLLALIPPALAGFYVFVVLSPHRWGRITALMDPWSMDNPVAYQPRQSLLAIMTGGWFGKGLGNGIQKMGFLPEDSTDFIFAVFCEEWGFIGAMLLMGLVLLWTVLVYRLASRVKDPFARVLAGSLGFLISIHAVMHMGVDLSVLPPTGMSFPFVSAGGTALVIMAWAVALLVSVSAHDGGGLGR